MRIPVLCPGQGHVTRPQLASPGHRTALDSHAKKQMVWDHGGCGRELRLAPRTEQKRLLLPSLSPLPAARQANAGPATGHVCESVDILDSLMDTFPAVGLGGARPLNRGREPRISQLLLCTKPPQSSMA